MSAISIKPIIATPFTVSKSRKLQKKSEFFAKRLDFCRDFSCRRSFTWAIRREKEKSMKGSNWVRATTSDEGVQAFEQDALVDGSLTFGAGGIEATLNNLVGELFISLCFLVRYFLSIIFNSVLSPQKDYVMSEVKLLP